MIDENFLNCKLFINFGNNDSLEMIINYCNINEMIFYEFIKAFKIYTIINLQKKFNLLFFFFKKKINEVYK